MQCAGCSRDAKYYVHAQLQPHCEDCMIESLCGAPTQVIEIEAYERMEKHEQRVKTLISA